MLSRKLNAFAWAVGVISLAYSLSAARVGTRFTTGEPVEVARSPSAHDGAGTPVSIELGFLTAATECDEGLL
jgi:hypothetical protein